MPAPVVPGNPAGARIRALRSAHGWSQTDLAERLGTTQSVVSAYEVGIRQPTVKWALAFARVFEVTVEEIFAEFDTTEAQQ